MALNTYFSALSHGKHPFSSEVVVMCPLQCSMFGVEKNWYGSVADVELWKQFPSEYFGVKWSSNFCTQDSLTVDIGCACVTHLLVATLVSVAVALFIL